MAREYRQNTFKKHVPEWVDTTKPLDFETYDKFWDEPNLKLHLPKRKFTQQHADSDIIRPNDGDAWDENWADFMETQADRMNDVWNPKMLAKYNPRKGATGEMTPIIEEVAQTGGYFDIGMNTSFAQAIMYLDQLKLKPLEASKGWADRLCLTVQMDNPMMYAAHMLGWMLRQEGVTLKEKYLTVPGDPFLNLVVDVNENITDKQKTFFNKTFANKYANWAIRPEEHMQVNLGIPAHKFCLYECPPHPQDGIGHEASAAAPYQVLIDMFDMPQWVKEIIYDTAFQISWLRVRAGVHDPVSAGRTMTKLGVKAP